MASQAIIAFAGTPVNTGAWLSTTVTFMVQEAVFPLLSVAVHITGVVPTVKAAGASLVNVPVTSLIEISSTINPTVPDQPAEGTNFIEWEVDVATKVKVSGVSANEMLERLTVVTSGVPLTLTIAPTVGGAPSLLDARKLRV